MTALESCMILLDNSEFMRNGDYIPTRLEAQHDAANMLVSAKTRNRESTVGVSAGTEVLVSPSTIDEMAKILGALNDVPMKDTQPDVAASIQVASLALKHRRNKNGGQRIVLFCGSPLTGVETRALTKAGRQLKKNNVAIDVVAMGELEDNENKLRELVEAANGRGDNVERTCHLVTIPAGVLPSDVLASSPIVNGPGGGGGGGAEAGGAGFGAPAGGDDLGGAFAEFGGINPEMDPELAMALRVSMEEERARQERATAAAASTSTEEGKEGDEAADAPAAAAAAAPAAPAMDLGLSEEESLLQQALAMSMGENNPPAAAAASSSEDAKEGGTGNAAAAAATTDAPSGMDLDDDDAAAVQMALQMSMQADTDEPTPEQQHFQDPQFVNQLLGSLPGVDPNDPQIQEALRTAREHTPKKEGEGDSKAEGKKDDEDEAKKD